MKNFKYDIGLYGHITYDHIFDGFKYRSSVGSIGNVWNQLKQFKVEDSYTVYVQPTEIGESLILTVPEQGKRTSISCLNQVSNKPVIESCTVSHVMYINELSDTSFIPQLTGFVTADVCNGKQFELFNKDFERIDLLLISDEDIDTKKLINTRFPRVIIHSSNGSNVWNGNEWKNYKAELVTDVDILGAGDKFAAYVIAHLVDHQDDLEGAVTNAHTKLTQQFKSEKMQSIGSVSG